MILMSPPIRLGKTTEEREEFLRAAETLGVTTVTVHSRNDWSDDDVESAREFLHQHGLRPGEFSGFYKGRGAGGGLGSYDVEDHKGAVAHYSQQMRHARILGSHCVGFSTYVGRGSALMWTAETWDRTVDAAKELADVAEEVGVDIAAHPHIMSPLNSVDRYVEMLQRVDSPRLKVLLDLVNLTTPLLIYNTTALVDEAFDAIGESVVALHAKDVVMSGGGKIVAHIDEAVPGTGTMDYAAILRRLDRLDHDVTVHVEHFPFAETVQGQQYIRSVARKSRISLN